VCDVQSDPGSFVGESVGEADLTLANIMSFVATTHYSLDNGGEHDWLNLRASGLSRDALHTRDTEVCG